MKNNKTKKIVLLAVISSLLVGLGTYFYLVFPNYNEENTVKNIELDKGMVTFIFDDGHSTFYDNAYPLFKEKGYPAVVAIDTLKWTLKRGDLMSKEEVLEMQNNGWEVMSHSVTHKNFDESTRVRVSFELIASKIHLELLGFDINSYVAPMSTYPLEKHKDLLGRFYKSGFTKYVNSREEPIESLAIENEVDVFELHRANMEGKSIEELKEYIDYVDGNKTWLILYEHQIGGEERYTETETLAELLDYVEAANVKVVSGTEAVETIAGIAE